MIVRALLVLSIVLCVALLFAQSGTAPREIEIDTQRQWTDTGIDVMAGDTLRIAATGTLRYPGAKDIGPAGLARGWMDLIRVMPLNEAGRGALIARIGDADAARPVLIGPRTERRFAVAGRLFLGINQPANDAAEGSFHVRIERMAQPVSTVRVAASEAALPKLTQEMLDQLPARVNDADGNVGDRVNFVIVGSEDRVRAALDTAGWVPVDRNTKDAVIRGVLASFSKEAYTTMPMSELLLFGRPQDFGYAQADPLRVVAARHHFRIWKAPIDLNGQSVWAGAGTHDIGIEKDKRNGKLTHKIDPAVDGERDYIARSLQESGLAAKVDYMTPSVPVREAVTATGGGFHSDGRTVVIYLQPDTSNVSAAFSDLFCSVLRQHNPDTGEWGACADYLDGAGKEDVALAPLPTTYRLLIVPGILSSCASDAPAFLEGQQDLREKHGMTVDLLNVPNDSSEQNAHFIAEYLKGQVKTDPRKFIVLGYSKGAPDLQVALAQEAGASEAVAAFITVAGASGGSPIADALPAIVDRWVSQFHMGKCEGDPSAGFKSLRRAVRQAFLASYPNPVVPTYSLVALADKNTASKMLQEAMQLLSVYDTANDSQLTKADAIVPGAKFLGAARADHLAVALPFDKVADGALRAAMNRARYPRAALLEALVRFVIQDLAGAK